MTQLLKRSSVTFAAMLMLLVLRPVAGAEPKLELRPGDHICIIGNTLAERMQHDGWLETLLHARFPEHKLVIRNLGYSGDAITTRLRSKNFGTPDEWLAGVGEPIGGYNHNRFEKVDTKADVIFAFFGYGESFAGPAGLDKFKADLDAWIKHTLAQKYNGKSAPRLVLFSPIAHEDLKDPNLPDGKANNANLKLYTQAMGDVAKANNIPFVDIFTASSSQDGKTKITIDGVHLNEHGGLFLASRIEISLFDSGPQHDARYVQRVRQAVLDKNFHWFNRYRVTDAYSTYGDRGFLTFIKSNPRNVDKTKVADASEVLPTNYEVLQRELEVLDVLTSNRDQRIWAAAQGKGVKNDDSNTPPFITTATNRPGEKPDGSHAFLGGEEAIAKMTPAAGLKVNLYVSEEMFPELAKPVQMAWDTKGRLWVAVWPSYPHWTPKTPMADKLLIFEDTNADGKADVCKTFAGDLHNPTGFEFYNNGVLVAQGPDLLFLKDTDGDDKYDVKERVLHGLDTADTHHTANSFTFDHGGALYFQEGVFHHTQVETPYGVVRNIDSGVYRYEPRTHKFEVYVSYGFANPHGHVFDRWGQDIVHDGTGAQPYLAASFSGHTHEGQKHPAAPQVYKQRTRPCSGTEILSSSHFPDNMQGHLMVGNVIGVLGILNYKLDEAGSGLAGTECEPVVQSTDPNFRPSDFEVGPDGALYFTDWHNPIIGHMQHNLRDPSRDKTHGRVYRVTAEGRPLLTPAKIAGEPIEKLLDLLKSPENRVRYRAKIELSGRDSAQVVSAVKQWVERLDKSSPDYEHQVLEALWVHQWHNVVNADLLKRVLRSPEPKARAAATRVLCYWRDRVENPLGLLKAQVADENPRVRLEAVRACSFFESSEAAEVALEAANKEMDPFLQYCLDETLKTLERYSK